MPSSDSFSSEFDVRYLEVVGGDLPCGSKVELKRWMDKGVIILAMIGAALVSISYLVYVYDPLQMIVKRLITLAPGSMFFHVWSAPPHEIFINVYIFNVTNANAFLEGREKLSFNQIGPYVYQEQIKNKNITFNPNGTVSYYPRRYLTFIRRKSVGDPAVDRLISPNIPLLGITASLQDASMFENLAVSTISNYLNSQAFLNITIDEYLWGYDDQLVELANQALPSWINFPRFGILDRLMAVDNATNLVTITTDPSLAVSKNPLLTQEEKTTLYHIEKFNGSPGLAHWGYKAAAPGVLVDGNTRCNTLEGAFDGTVFPPYPSKNTTLRLYRRAFCRPVPTLYDGKGITYDGFEADRFRVDPLYLAAPEENPDNACYCPKRGCLPKGLSSIAPCYYDIPIAISQPHFYNSDPLLIEQVGGMRPNRSLHDTFFYLHPVLGMPMDANLRIQINLDVGETKYNTRTEPFNHLVLPLFWLEMAVEKLPAQMVFLVTLIFHVCPVIQTLLIYFLGLFGLALISFSALHAIFHSNGNRALPLNHIYSPIPILPLARQYFKPGIRISK